MNAVRGTDDVFITEVVESTMILVANAGVIQGEVSSSRTSFPHPHEPDHVEATDLFFELGLGDVRQRDLVPVLGRKRAQPSPGWKLQYPWMLVPLLPQRAVCSVSWHDALTVLAS